MAGLRINAGYFNQTGSYNTYVGFNAGSYNSTGTQNTFMGNVAGELTTAGYDNVFIGFSAGRANSSGNVSTFVGSGAGRTNTTGSQNTFLGYQTGYNTNASANTFVGYRAGYANTSGQFNSFIGVQTGQANTTGSFNVFIGDNAGQNSSTGTQNTFMGYRAGLANTTGSTNVFIGNQAGGANTSGGSNLFIGSYAGGSNTSGNLNLFMGDGSGYSNKTGGQNTYLGQYAGFYGNDSGSNNVFLGYLAGSGTSSSAPVVTNSVAIGANAIVTQSNSIVLGGTGANAVNVGIGTTAPTNKLHVVSGTGGVSGLRLESLPISSSASVTNQTKFLTVDGQGNVILGSLNGSPRIGVEESLWQRAGQSLQSVAGSRVVIGERVDRTPAGYRLFVEEGILTEKVKVAVKTTADWSDKVFAPTYVLKSLAQVEQYINQYQHLPGIPSAKEMVEQGNDLHKTDAKLLEKIEELTLYSIEQQKEIESLKQLVKQLLEKSR